MQRMHRFGVTTMQIVRSDAPIVRACEIHDPPVRIYYVMVRMRVCVCVLFSIFLSCDANGLMMGGDDRSRVRIADPSSSSNGSHVIRMKFRIGLESQFTVA